eukprot:TRINITY_DN67747_c0_g1_i1.p1 TRINITY_DN67747_c0_g1~~TRINITY_DN67747_c0_g1_i1.p1  ORF type:complete len:236 (+),score=19.63 TRINITY_DN67747_c0_g1_i1:156-863(+)
MNRAINADTEWKRYVKKEKNHFARWEDPERTDVCKPRRGSEQEHWDFLCEKGARGEGPLCPAGAATMPPVKEARMRFRLPRAGEPVRLDGINGRPELNGALGEVVSHGLDDEGFVSVRYVGRTMMGGAARNAGGADPEPGRVLKVRPHRLLPLEVARGGSMVALGASTLGATSQAFDGASVRSCSLVSGEGRSSAGRSTYSGTTSASGLSRSTARTSSAIPVDPSYYHQRVVPRK